ncbi:MAG TPA: ABC transporter permease [Firmicutes bacterium]|nr:ABC transporter permease [Candidatus Fermentithermobacillaceae bacterium]
MKGGKAVTSSTAISYRSKDTELRKAIRRFARRKVAVIGAALVLVFVAIALAAPLLITQDPNDQNLAEILKPPGKEHFLGTDELGRDIWSRVIYGARVSLIIGIASVLVAIVVGVPLGAIAGYYGGWIDEIMMRVLDVLLAFPGVLLTIVLVVILGPSLQNVIISVAVYSVPGFARLARGEALGLRNAEFIEASQALGAPGWWVIATHVIPNIISPVIVMGTLSVGNNILTAASMGFLGMGVPPDVPEWGAMLSNGRKYLLVAPHAATIPGLAILLLVLGLNLFGDGLRDILDPKMRE